MIAHDGATRPFHNETGSRSGRTRALARLALLLLAIAGLFVLFLVTWAGFGATLKHGAIRQAQTDGRPVLVTADHALVPPDGGRDGCMLRPGSVLRLLKDTQEGSSIRVTVSSASDVPTPGDCRTGDAGRVDVDTLSGWKVLRSR